ncbi:hypothetical protein LUW74_32610 [Actinomadura madurae]|uniref:hypothetical protein n=1 Tax=Actinomadura madurae TaxID=1993 RepID=UPI002025C582|nr:hypothetical protein [Actinomadura madurae]URN07633.1 hypothetical protein LUW74_32610 [Actinomadura madurae]
MADLLVSELGFTRVPGLDIDPTKDEMEKGVRDFCGRCSPDDLLVIYHTGHGDLVGGRHRLWMGDATGDRLAGTLPTADLAELALTDTPLRHLLLIVDACFAGRGGAQSLVAGMEAIGSSKDKTLTVLASAHPLEQVRAGDFAGLFRDAVHHRATAGHEPRYLLPQGLADYMKDSPNRKKWQTISCSTLYETQEGQRFFPNPRHDPRLRGLDVLTQTMMREQERREQDLRTHFLPRARGVDVPAEVWRFVGRHAALRELSRWLADGTGAALRVVTGDPGSGKSAVLARLAVLSDPTWREAVPLDGVPADTVPGPGSIDVPVHARGRTSEQILAALAAAAQVSASTPGELLLAIQGRRLVAIIDAVDEAVDPDRVVSWLLQPLILGARPAGLRLLIGTRKHLVDRLGAPGDHLDLDAPEYADELSLRRYASRCLRESVPDSVFRNASDEVTRPVAEAVAEAAGRSFLVALIVSRTLAAGERIPDAADRAWRASLPGTAADAMHQDLETRLGAEAERARELLRPLAYASGAGLPWAGTWAPLAAEFSGHPYGDEDIVWLMHNAGAYVVEAEEEGSSVYRLYHLSLAEYLRRGRSEREANDVYVTYLENRVPEVSPGHRDWTMAPAYTRAHLATHARAAGRFGRFVTDGLYLATANPAGVVAALASLTDQAETAAAAAYQRALHLLRNTTIAERLSYLELWGQRLGAETLVAHIGGSTFTRAWTTDWVQWPMEYPHRVLPGHHAAVTSMVVLDGEPPTAVTVGFDGDLYVWDLRTAEPLAIWELGDAPVLSVRAAATPEAPGMVAAIDAHLRLHRLDVGTWTRRESVVTAGWLARLPFRAAPTPVLMCGVLSDSRLVAYVGGKGLRARVWNLRSGELITTLHGAGPDWAPVSFGELRNHRPVLLMRRAARWVDHQYWDLVTGRPLVEAPVRPRYVRETNGTLDYYRDAQGRPVAAAVFGRRTTFWDLMANAEFLPDDEPRGRNWTRMPPRQVEKVIATRYPDAEPVLETGLDNAVAHAIEQARPEDAQGDLLPGDYFNDRQAFQFVRSIQGRRETVTLSGHTAAITEMGGARIDDHSVVLTASNDGSARLWDLTLISRLPLAVPPKGKPDASSPVYRLAVGTLPCGDRVVLSLGASGVVLWGLQEGEKRVELAGRGMSRSSAVALVDNGDGGLRAVVFGTDGRAYVWDAATGRPEDVTGIDPINWVMRAAGMRRADGTVALVTSGHGPRLLGWDLPGWTFRKTMRGHAGWSSDVDCGRDARGRPIAVTGGTDGRVCLWDLKSFRRRRKLRSMRRWRLFVGRGVSARVRAVRLLPFPLAAVLTHDGHLRIMDLRTGRFMVGALAAAGHLATAEFTDGRTMVVTATDRGRVVVWQVLSGGPRRRTLWLEVAAYIDVEVPVTGIELEPDGLLVLGTAHGVSCLRLTLETEEIGLNASRTPAASDGAR